MKFGGYGYGEGREGERIVIELSKCNNILLKLVHYTFCILNYYFLLLNENF
jgi:hypothetical protein